MPSIPYPDSGHGLHPGHGLSRTIRTSRVDFLIDQVEDFLLVVAGVAVLDPADSQIEYAASNSLINETGQVSLLASGHGALARHS